VGAVKEKRAKSDFSGSAKPQHLLELFGDFSAMGIGRWECEPRPWEGDTRRNKKVQLGRV